MADVHMQLNSLRQEVQMKEGALRTKEQEMSVLKQEVRAHEQMIRVKDQHLTTLQHDLSNMASARDEVVAFSLLSHHSYCLLSHHSYCLLSNPLVL